MTSSPQLPPVPAPPPKPIAAPPASIEQIVKHALAQKASDIHIRVGEVVRYRLDGQMMPLRHQSKVTPDIFTQYLQEILSPAQQNKFAETKEIDTAIFYPGLVRCRVNCFDTLTGGGIVLRLIPIKVPSIDELGLPEVFKDIVLRPQGLVLVIGATGSGKSTTLAAMMRHLNETASKHIVTIEDPIEYVHSSYRCLISQREVGLHASDFHVALRAVLREDPDVILIGEMRDRITVDTALKAAQTGHLVLGTLHARNALNAINRLLGIYNPDEQVSMRLQIADALVAIIAQVLIQTTDNGRTAAHEILINTPTMRDYLLKGNEEDAYQLMEASSNEGMQVINQALCQLLLLGKISSEEAMKVTPDIGDLHRRLYNEGLSPEKATREVSKSYSYTPL